MAPQNTNDNELLLVAAELTRLDPTGDRFAGIIRETLDQLLDGNRTGRWDYHQLHKTEKTHMGTLIEINLQKSFNFDDGDATDYRIAGIEVDCKFSQRVGGWELGPEMVGHLCLVVWASDRESRWRAGLIRANEEYLRPGGNRDHKRTLTSEAVNHIRWLWPDNNQLVPNQLLHLPEDARNRIMSATGANKNGKGVQARINQLFREVQGVIVRRTTIETVGYGADDPLKRARGNGGARDLLRSEGIAVLGHQDNDPKVAAALGLPIPHKGEFVAARLVPAPQIKDDRPIATIDGYQYVIATKNDPITPAPTIPRS